MGVMVVVVCMVTIWVVGELFGGEDVEDLRDVGVAEVIEADRDFVGGRTLVRTGAVEGGSVGIGMVMVKKEVVPSCGEKLDTEDDGPRVGSGMKEVPVSVKNVDSVVAELTSGRTREDEKPWE